MFYFVSRTPLDNALEKQICRPKLDPRVSLRFQFHIGHSKQRTNSTSKHFFSYLLPIWHQRWLIFGLSFQSNFQKQNPFLIIGQSCIISQNAQPKNPILNGVQPTLWAHHHHFDMSKVGQLCRHQATFPLLVGLTNFFFAFQHGTWLAIPWYRE